MIELIPAIDLMDGKCVRLSKGDFKTKKVFSSDPVDMALRFEDSGFRHLHLVDLDGADKGRIKHLKILEKIAAGTGLDTDFGGGVNNTADVRSIFNSGAMKVCIGSMAVKNEDEFDEVLDIYGHEKVILAADARNEKLVVSGWKEMTGVSLFDYIEKMIAKGVSEILCTDVDKDGMLEGTSVSLYERILEKFPGLRLIASGGVSGIRDIEILDRSAVPAVVFGKAFYEGKLKIEEMRHYINY
ncbi:MAG: 1-(5-phosphoribosyl)-5-[(5-phosphoribosylamino)methylideneamino]imidazole-4-carboxamide isomerase [Bacteroidales bacterium]